MKAPQYERLPKTDRFRPCNMGIGRVSQFSGHYKDVVCTLFMSELPHTTQFQHTYTIVRDPREHVLSQYFHCTESGVHKNRAHFMPETGPGLVGDVD